MNMSEIHYFIGDVHGMYEQLVDILDHIHKFKRNHKDKSHRIVFLGDYIDRGKDSKKVLNLIKEYNSIEKVVMLLGNHDAYFIETYGYNVSIDEKHEDFIYNGGVETLESFNYDAKEMADTAEWLKNNTYLYYNHLDLVAVHAGIDWTKIMMHQTTRDLICIRDKFLEVKKIDYPFRIIHGHTITPSRKVEIYKHRIAVDTGAFLTGKLSCVVMETKDFKSNVIDILSVQGEPNHDYLRKIK